MSSGRLFKLVLVIAVVTSGGWFGYSQVKGRNPETSSDGSPMSADSSPQRLSAEGSRPVSATKEYPVHPGLGAESTVESSTSKSRGDSPLPESPGTAPDRVIGMIPDEEILFTSDYMTYDRATLLALTEVGDPAAVSIASIHATYFTLDEREAFTRRAASLGDVSGFPRMYIQHSSVFVNAPQDVDLVKAYAYLLASVATGQLDEEILVLTEFEQLSEEELSKANALSDLLQSLAEQR